jgi:hypothetical protein
MPPQPGHAHGAPCSTTSRGNVSGSGRRAGLRRCGAISASAAGSSGSGGVASATCSSESPSSSSSCSMSLRSFSDDEPNRSRSSRARRSFSCSFRSTCSRSPLRAAVSSAACRSSSAACSPSRSSSNRRNAITLLGSSAGSSGVGMRKASINQPRRAKNYLTSSRHLRTPCPHR